MNLPWPDQLLHGTSAKGLARLRRTRVARGLFLTDDESTAFEYAESNAYRDRSVPVIVELSVAVLRAAGGHLRADYNEDNEIIIEHYIYVGRFPQGAIVRATVIPKSERTQAWRRRSR